MIFLLQTASTATFLFPRTASVSSPKNSTNCKLVNLTIGYEKETLHRRTNPAHTQGV